MYRRIMLWVVVAVHIAFSAQAGADMTKQELQAMYRSYLTEKGYSSAVDQEGDILFVYTIQGRPFYFYIIIYEEDQQCFQIAAVQCWEIKTGEELKQSLIAASTVTHNNWVVKASVNTEQKSVNFSAEMLLVKPEDFTQVFDAMLAFMEESILDFAAQRGEGLP